MIAVVGFSSVDRSLRVDRLPAAGVTARVLDGGGIVRFRPGGIGHTVLALAAAVGDGIPICTVGDDPAGRAFVDSMAEAGCRTDGIEVLGDRSPTSLLLYDGDGATACVFEPGAPWTSLTERQHRLVAAADVVTVMIGPAEVTGQALDAARADATIAWVVKNDPAALVPSVVARLRQRADIVFHNVAESTVVGPLPAEASPTVVCTNGPRPVVVSRGGRRSVHAVAPCAAAATPTGAGDAFAGGYLAAWLGRADDESCVAAGTAAARRRIADEP